MAGARLRRLRRRGAADRGRAPQRAGGSRRRAAAARGLRRPARVSRPHAADGDTGADAPSPQQHLHAFLRSLDPAAEGLPDRFLASLERALGHYDVGGLDRTPALEAACYRLFLSRQRADTASTAIRTILERHLEHPGEHLECSGSGPIAPRRRGCAGVLDRLEAALAATEPGLAELVREVRWRCCDQPMIEEAREELYASVDQHLAALAAEPDPAEREFHARALVECPQPLAPLRVPAGRRRRGVPEAGAAGGDDAALLPGRPAGGDRASHDRRRALPADVV